MSFQWVTLLQLTSMVVPQKKTICFKEIARIAGDGVARPSATHTGKQSTDGVLAVMRVKSRAALVCACTNMRLGSDDPKVIPVEVPSTKHQVPSTKYQPSGAVQRRPGLAEHIPWRSVRLRSVRATEK